MKSFFLIVFFILLFSNVYASKPVRCRNLLKPGVYTLSDNVTLIVKKVLNSYTDSYIKYDPEKDTEKLELKVLMSGRVVSKLISIDFVTCVDGEDSSFLQSLSEDTLSYHNIFELKGAIINFNEKLPHEENLESSEISTKRNRFKWSEADSLASYGEELKKRRKMIKSQLE